jgi:hypothetical protein
MTNNTNGKVSVAWQVPIGCGEKNKKKEKGEKEKEKEKDDKNKDKINDTPEVPSFEGKNAFFSIKTIIVITITIIVICYYHNYQPLLLQ